MTNICVKGTKNFTVKMVRLFDLDEIVHLYESVSTHSRYLGGLITTVS